MGANNQFETDYRLISDKFPKLNNSFWSEKLNSWVIDGQLDICDTKGEYWDTFDIRIVVPNTYPYCVPIVLERSSKIPREADRHISKEGICCVDISHQLLRMSRRGIRLIDFVTNKVYPYFANQVYYESEHHYSSGEYAHNFDGVKQFYFESTKIASIEEAIMILDYMVNGKELGRNANCFCGKSKYKKCHLQIVEFLQSIGKGQLKQDLLDFRKEIEGVSNLN